MGRARRQAAQRAFDRERDDHASRAAPTTTRDRRPRRARGRVRVDASAQRTRAQSSSRWASSRRSRGGRARARAAKTDGDDASDRSARGAAATEDGVRKRLSFSGSSLASAADDAAATTDATIERDEGERGESARVETVENENARPAARAVEEKAVDSGEAPRPATPPRADGAIDEVDARVAGVSTGFETRGRDRCESRSDVRGVARDG